MSTILAWNCRGCRKPSTVRHLSSLDWKRKSRHPFFLSRQNFFGRNRYQQSMWKKRRGGRELRAQMRHPMGSDAHAARRRWLSPNSNKTRPTGCEVWSTHGYSGGFTVLWFGLGV
ncbi:hypothetical protein IFM89_002002 [Coptis chinensis]|uniref:Uncharacterized protein n=1 Tax=Coptis chinensis TaxID=261450 RepID=A0A835HKH6_9MAGN|nr:hypothetical protein IFM89_002002 [Coptis chinensis]